MLGSDRDLLVLGEPQLLFLVVSHLSGAQTQHTKWSEDLMKTVWVRH